MTTLIFFFQIMMDNHAHTVPSKVPGRATIQLLPHFKPTVKEEQHKQLWHNTN